MSEQSPNLFELLVDKYNSDAREPLSAQAVAEMKQRAVAAIGKDATEIADQTAPDQKIEDNLTAWQVAEFCDWLQKNGKAPVTLFDVLVKEYNSQDVDPYLPLPDILNLRLRSYQRVSKRTLTIDEAATFAELNKIIDDDLVAVFYDWLHTHKVKRAALCLSGGGIRSGTFALGLIQGLARHNLLSKFDYLSTVSGGGYIGSWLTAWIHRQPDGLNGVTNELRRSAPSSRIDPDPSPIHFLREYSSFLTPEVGLLSADSWTFAGIYLRNLFLNWLVFIPLLISVLSIPRFVVALTLAQPEREDQRHLSLNLLWWHPDLFGRHIFLLFGFALGVWALAYVNFNRPGVREILKQRSRFWGERADQKNFLVFCLAPLVASATLLTTYWAWSREAAARPKDILPFLLFGIAFTLGAWLVASLILRRLFRPQEINWLELFALLVGGILAGLFFWIISQGKIGNPVIGYHRHFNWTSWTSWLAWRTELYVCFGVPVFLLVFLLGATFFVGVSSFSTRIDDEDREWWSRLGAWILIVILGWSLLTLLVLFGPIALLESPKIIASLGGVSGLVAILLGHSAQTSAQKKPADEKDKSAATMIGSFIAGSLPLLAFAFLAVFIAALSLLTTGIFQGLALGAQKVSAVAPVEWLTNVPEAITVRRTLARVPLGYDWYIQHIYSLIPTGDIATTAKIVHMNVLHHTSVWFVLVVGLGMFGCGMGLAKVINLNLFSLHASYRNRLIRAFLGASRPNHERKPNPFTGFDVLDNIHMHELRPGLLDERDLIDPVRLAQQLMDETRPLSEYLAESNHLESLKVIPVKSTASQRLTAALRSDLNGVLEGESLYRLALAERSNPRVAKALTALETKFGEAFLRLGLLRGDYQLVINRLILEEAYPDTIVPCRYPLPPYKLLHIVNTTLNLVGGANLAWQQRKAEPFSISPLHAGCFRLGYRDSRHYGGRDTGGISLGTAAAISGAAASSNMGYYTTSPVLSLVLTLFNVRLGWWLGNPGQAGQDTYDLRAPKYSVQPLVAEAFGLTNDQNKYVYLTDGGHFENLGLYEMVLRRCRMIVLSDGAQDENYHFSDLGNAVRKIRIDLGIPIEFSSVPIYAASPDPEKGKGMYWAVGKIRYSCIDGAQVPDGILLYIKPAVYEVEPRDVLEYRKSYPAFPHQSTADQFFDEPQFESYRMLGSFIMDQLCGEGTEDLDLETVMSKAVEQTLNGKAGGDDLKSWFEKWQLACSAR